MKVKYLLICILTLVFAGCQDTTSYLKISQSKLDLNEVKSTFTIEIASNSSWSLSSSADWCVPDKTEGVGNSTITFSISGNRDLSVRKAEIRVISKDNSQVVELSQAASRSYTLPVIFHVLYKDENAPLQYVSQSRLSEILDVVNKLYKDKTKSVDMNLTFTLATTDESGKALSVPGVEYVQWSGTYPIDCDTFMQDNSGTYVKYIWDPNQYINVMIYNFTSDPASNTTTLGISHIPYSTTGSTYLEGLNRTSLTYIDKSNLKYPYCTSINSKFINDQSTATEYKTSDVTVTLAHELGHYLGLYHAFSENEDGYFDGCVDSDYCKDTPTYNKVVYDKWLDMQLAAGVRDLPTLAKRENCITGQEFTSYNIMDYAISYSDRFTNDQHDRIRHVLTYSPLIPGPKQGQTGTRTVVEGPLDLPIRTIK